MLVIAQGCKFGKGGNIVHHQSELAARTAVLTMVEPSLHMRDVGEEPMHVLGGPHETAAGRRKPRVDGKAGKVAE